MWTDLLDAVSMLAVLALALFFGWRLVHPLPEDEEPPVPDPETQDPSLEPWRRH